MLPCTIIGGIPKARPDAERHVCLVAIIDAYRYKKPPSSPPGELEGSMLVAIIDGYRDKKPPSSPRDGELEGSIFGAIIDAYRGKRAALQPPVMGSQKAARWHAKSSNSRFAAACVRDRDLPPQERGLGPICSIGRS